jgi:hypothetical protein
MQSLSSLSGGPHLRAARRQQSGSARRSCVAAPLRASAASTEHVRYVNEVAVVPGRPKVETLLRVREPL